MTADLLHYGFSLILFVLKDMLILSSLTLQPVSPQTQSCLRAVPHWCSHYNKIECDSVCGLHLRAVSSECEVMLVFLSCPDTKGVDGTFCLHPPPPRPPFSSL